MNKEDEVHFMYTLKPLRKIDNVNVKCPVVGCPKMVSRQRKGDILRSQMFKCPLHNIYISPSTFEYENESDNLLWNNDNDLELLTRIKKVKRESRMARENSEDAVTWNVFRYLEKNELVKTVFDCLLDDFIESPEIIYWSYSQKENDGWSVLNRARDEFGEQQLNRSSEPDIIIYSKNVLFFIEAKLAANNETVPSDPSNLKKYTSGTGGWFDKVFRSDFKSIAVEARKYELLRFWLIGTWMADQLGLRFYLLNLVRDGFEKDIEGVFGEYINRDRNRNFRRITWEGIYKAIKGVARPTEATELMLEYFRNKTLGYDSNGSLRRAFICS
jgi:hypothetical protein